MCGSSEAAGSPDVPGEVVSRAENPLDDGGVRRRSELRCRLPGGVGFALGRQVTVASQVGDRSVTESDDRSRPAHPSRNVESPAMREILLVGFGGFVGSVCRYLAGGWVQRLRARTGAPRLPPTPVRPGRLSGPHLD
jgi:hypothetical protein